MRRTPDRRSSVPALAAAALVVVVAAALGGGGTAAAQEDPAEARAIATDLERLRNNPFFADQPDRVRDLVVRLLDRRSARADAALRGLLLDPRSHTNLVEQIAILAVLSTPHVLLDDVVERLRTEPPGSSLERRLEAPLLRADADVVRRLGELVRDPGRASAYRAVAARLLGRTGDAAGLAVLAEAWAGPDSLLRDAARAAFDDAAPGAAASAEEARGFVERLRRDDLSLAEANRRMLRDRVRRDAAQPSRTVTPRDYSDLALAVLPRATLDQVLRLYVLGSPVPEVRAAAVQRLATHPYDSEPDADARVRTARALFEALRREDSPAVEGAILVTLGTLAPAIRGGVGPEEMEALTARIRPGTRADRETRLAAARLAGQVRDERAVPALEDAFASFGDGDDDARLALLDAMHDIPSDRTAWLVERTRAERRPRVARKLVVMLSRSQSPSAVEAFAALLGDPSRADAETRVEAAKALATQWAVRADVAARDALLSRGLADPEPAVRAAAAGALGIAGPDREASVQGLLRAVRGDADAEVRRAAARSVIVLDEERATAHLIDRLRDDAAVWEAWRDHVVDVVRRDQAPDRAVAAASTLVGAGLRALAIDVVGAAADAADPARGRARLREELARLLLDEGRWDEAQRIARTLASEAGDDAARDRVELIAVRALVASGEAARLEEAERRLTALLGAGRLDPASAVDAAATLGDGRLRRGDAIGAVEALSADPRPAADPVRRRFELLLADAQKKVAQQRTAVLELVQRVGGADADDARRKLASDPFRGIAAWHLDRELAAATDAATAGRLLAAADVVVGGGVPQVAADEDAGRAADAVRAARALLAKVPRTSPAVR